MTSLIYFAGVGDTLQDFHLAGNSGQAWNGSGQPWTLQATTPVRIAIESDVTLWTPQAAAEQILYAGGAPFALEPIPLGRSVGVVTETIPIKLFGTTPDNAIALLRELRRRCIPPQGLLSFELRVQPIGTTNPAIFRVYRATVQEDPRFAMGIEGSGSVYVIRANLTIERSAYARSTGTPAALLTNQTYTNNGSAAGNYIAIGNSVTTGDLLFDGQPMRVSITTTASDDLSGAGVKRIWCAMCGAPTFTERSDAISTTSSSGVNVGSSATMNASSNYAMGTRIIARVTSPSANLQLRALVYLDTSGAGSPIFTGEWVTPGAVANAYCDLGGYRLTPAVSLFGGYATTAVVVIQARSTDGGSATGTLDYIESIPYRSWCRIESPTLSAGSVRTIVFGEYAPSTTYSDYVPGGAAAITSGVNQGTQLTIRGTLPRAADTNGIFSNLYLAWDTGGVHDENDTISVSAAYLPLYTTLRGAG
jgi:hypothetical protein